MIHIEDLPFRAIPTFEAENVLKGKNGFLSLGGDKKKFAKCIEEGDAEICEVAVVSEFENDAAKRQSAESKKGFVIHYFLGRDEYYKLIVPAWAKDLKLFVPELDSHYGHKCLVSLD